MNNNIVFNIYYDCWEVWYGEFPMDPWPENVLDEYFCHFCSVHKIGYWLSRTPFANYATKSEQIYIIRKSRVHIDSVENHTQNQRYFSQPIDQILQKHMNKSPKFPW